MFVIFAARKTARVSRFPIWLLRGVLYPPYHSLWYSLHHVVVTTPSQHYYAYRENPGAVYHLQDLER